MNNVYLETCGFSLLATKRFMSIKTLLFKVLPVLFLCLVLSFNLEKIVKNTHRLYPSPDDTTVAKKKKMKSI